MLPNLLRLLSLAFFRLLDAADAADVLVLAILKCTHKKNIAALFYFEFDTTAIFL